MEQQHAAWVAEHVEGTGYGKCAHYTTEMQKAFPYLERVRGFYHCPLWGRREHWWLVDEWGIVIDPTVAQFPSGGIGRYEPVSDEDIERKVPVGKCANCGCDIYRGQNDYGSGLCSKACGDDYVAYCSGRR